MTAVPSQHNNISSELLQAHQTLLGHGSALHDLATPSVPEEQHASVYDVPNCRQIIVTAEAIM